MDGLREYISKNMLWVVKFRRYIIALRDSRSTRKLSYSQHSEDIVIDKLLKNMDLSEGMYIDVGANHPTLHSNTYLFYRNNGRGILVEPDNSLCKLLNKFRPEDTIIRALVGSEKQLMKFNHSYNSALSSVNSLPDSSIKRSEFIPQITLDDITYKIDPLWFFLLSIDAEGMDLAVLMGGEQTLERTFLVCIENTGEDFDKIDSLLKNKSFQLVKEISVNNIYRNTNLSKRL